MSRYMLDTSPDVRPATLRPLSGGMTEHGLVRAHALAALGTLIIAALCGTAVAIKFLFPQFLGSHAWTTWGVLRYDHTQGILFGWLGNAFLAFFYHATPRLAGRPVTSRRLGWWLFGLWNLGMVLPGWLLLEAGFSHWLLAVKPQEWTEFPLAVNLVTELCLALMVAQFAWPMMRGPERHALYVSAWYIMGGAVFSLLAFPMGSVIPQLVPGAIGAAFSGLWIHDAVGLLVTPFTLAISYYVIPAGTGRPVHSHFLSMIGFWVLFFIYPLNGTHHYVYSAIPMEAQRAAIAASIVLGLDVILVVVNQLASVRGALHTLREDIALRFAVCGVIFYLIVSIQGALQALMPVQRTTHFTDWVIGHSHLAMLGFASFIAVGGLLHAWQRLPNRRYHDGMARTAFWLMLAGLVVMVIDLSVAGLVQGTLWQQHTPWLASVSASRIYWWIRALCAIPLLTGFGLLIAALLCGERRVAARDRQSGMEAMA